MKLSKWSIRTWESWTVQSRKNMKKAEITVFLSMVLLLIFALVGTMIEGARISAAKAIIEQTLSLSMESILGEYSLPLMEEYHLFFLDTGYGKPEKEAQQIETKMKDYMEATFDSKAIVPSFDLLTLSHNLDLYDIGVKENLMEKEVGVTDYECRPYLHEANAYMKYHLPFAVLEQDGEQYQVAKGTSGSAKIMEQKLEAEEEAAKLSEYVLGLVCNIEGIHVDKKGLHYTRDHLLEAEQDFVKRVCVGPITKEGVRISHSLVYRSVVPSYVKPVDLLNEIRAACQDIQKMQKEIQSLEAEKAGLEQKRDALQSSASASVSQGRQKQNSKQAKAVEEARNKELEQVSVQIQTVMTAMDTCRQTISTCLQAVATGQRELSQLSEGTRERIERCLLILPKIKEQQERAQRELEDYESELEQRKEDISTESYQSLKEEAAETEESIQNLGTRGTGVVSGQQLAMIQQELEYDRELLTWTNSVTGLVVSEREEDLAAMETAVVGLIPKIVTYQTSSFVFDYSSLKVQEEVDDPVRGFQKLMEKGVMSLVVDDVDALSAKEITGEELPSSSLSQIPQETTEVNGEVEDAKKSFGDIGEEGQENAKVSSAEDLMETIVFQEYLLEQFGTYLTRADSVEAKADQTPTSKEEKNVLDYELEYILCGNSKDTDNLGGTVNRILQTRMVMNLFYLFTDREKMSMAFMTAQALVGFTCMQPLIQLTKVLILLVWAYEEALVDVSALLDGKCVPLMKGKSSFKVQWKDLLSLNRTSIRSKSDTCVEKKPGIGYMDYMDYIKVLLFLTNQEEKSLRSLDLIQENCNLRYETELRIANCIFGYNEAGTFTVGPKFMRLPFITRLFGSGEDGYEYSVTKNLTY